ncbi:lipopolysaccharide kinase InaA family protein [Formosa maritima]|uniref:Kdo domain containing protein n=1 Tax=Formosa maritima TaxID=2592046 RepID=A0A5D0G410_9FLAO|nr:lipopolysaccharide kinase InaA family protein [Formosa maritima]TYA53883.1 Kdo domain containing protein [Formosa maritima]
MKYEIQNNFSDSENELKDYILNFDVKGDAFGNQKRNSLKLFKLNDLTINVKSFRVPNIINQIVYRFFRKSKAQRSFQYANKLLQLDIGTPNPIAYFEFTTVLLFKKSYYVSEHLQYDLTYRELTKDLNYPDHENILRAFTRFTYQLHQKNIQFLDHSPGNTLIKKIREEYHFYLVDLNRMKFKPMDFETRIKNFSRLTIHKSMVEVMSDEYAKVSGEGYNKIFNLMWGETEAFQHRYYRKKRLKNKLKFWKK